MAVKELILVEISYESQYHVASCDPKKVYGIISRVEWIVTYILVMHYWPANPPSWLKPTRLFCFPFPVLQLFCEAKRTSPSILYIPHLQRWWDTVGPALRATFLSLLSDIPPFSPILLLATCSHQYRSLFPEVSSGPSHRQCVTVSVS